MVNQLEKIEIVGKINVKCLLFGPVQQKKLKHFVAKTDNTHRSRVPLAINRSIRNLVVQNMQNENESGSGSFSVKILSDGDKSRTELLTNALSCIKNSVTDRKSKSLSRIHFVLNLILIVPSAGSPDSSALSVRCTLHEFSRCISNLKLHFLLMKLMNLFQRCNSKYKIHEDTV